MNWSEKYFLRLMVLFVTPWLLVSCQSSSSHSLNPNLINKALPFFGDPFVVTRNRSFVIPVGSNIYIPIPRARLIGEEGEEVDESQTLMEIQTSAFATHFAHVRSGKYQMTLEESLKFAKTQKMNFLLYANIRGWHKTQLLKSSDCTEEVVEVETSRGISQLQTLTSCDWDVSNPIDHANLSIWMYEVNSKKLVDVITVDTRSGKLTFAGDTPISLLERPLAVLAQTYSAQ